MTTPKNGTSHPTPLVGTVVPAIQQPRLETWQDQHAAAVAESDRHRRDLARALGMSPEEPWRVLIERARVMRVEHVKYQDAAAAFEACLKGRPEHVHTRPVCKAGMCDLLPKKDGLCNRCYEAAQRGGE